MLPTFYSWDGGLDVCVDLTGSSPLTQTGMADFVPGRAVIDAAQRKRGKYMAKCVAIGYGFLPFSFSSLGELEADAVTLLKRIRKRLASKVSAIVIGHSLDGYLDGLQFGVGVAGGSEAILHSVNRLIEACGDDVGLSMLLVDFKNAFNLVDREVMLREVRLRFPSISLLHPLICKIRDSFSLSLHTWYLDDGPIVGDTMVVGKVLELIMEDGPGCRLHLNVDKIEVFWPKEDPRSRLAGDVLNYAFLASRLQSAGLQTKLLRHTGIVSPGLIFDDALSVFNKSVETDLLGNPSEIAAPKLMKKMADIYFTRVTKNAESTFSLSPRQIALWTSQKEDHTSDWLRTVPISGLGETMNACSRVFPGDIYGDHVVSYAGIIGIKHRHNVVRDTLIDICYRFGISAGLDVCVDLTGSSPLTQTGMVDFIPGRAVIDAAQRKRGKYMAKCAAIGYGFLPFSFSSLGELEADAVTLLKRIHKFSMAQDIGTRAAVHIFNRISFAIAKGRFIIGGGCDKALRPAGILLYSWDERLDVYVDLTGSSPLTQTGMADFVPGRVVIDAAQRKRGKYMVKCATIRYEFLLFSFSSCGELEAYAVTLVKRIRKFSMAQDIGARATIHIFNSISFPIAKRLGLNSFRVGFLPPSSLQQRGEEEGRDHVYECVSSTSHGRFCVLDSKVVGRYSNKWYQELGFEGSLDSRSAGVRLSYAIRFWAARRVLGFEGSFKTVADTRFCFESQKVSWLLVLHKVSTYWKRVLESFLFVEVIDTGKDESFAGIAEIRCNMGGVTCNHNSGIR
ncbi:hypothetical protein Tco_0844478 [Tanacetum coccineum]